MWIADGWKDYELLDCGGAEKLPRSSGSFVKDFPQKGRKCLQGIMRRFYLC